MPRIAGTDEYYRSIEREMEQRCIDDWREAEIEMLYRVIRSMRLTDGKTHREIQDHLEKVWGLKQGAYRRRLEKVRQRYVVP